MGEIKRVIKFRVWEASALGSAMTYIDDMYWFEEQSVHSIEDDGVYKFMQFTGLHDKNGKDIYEGDAIVSPGMIESPYIVEWKDYHGWALRHPNTEAIWLSSHVWDNANIIGNIHEHPHLLNTIP